MFICRGEHCSSLILFILLETLLVTFPIRIGKLDYTTVSKTKKHCVKVQLACRGKQIAPKDLSANPRDLFLRSKNADNRPYDNYL